MPSRILGTFVGGSAGQWQIMRSAAVLGAGLPAASHLAIVETEPGMPASVQGVWVFRGVTSFERYVRANEQTELLALQPPLRRLQATRAAPHPHQEVG